MNGLKFIRIQCNLSLSNMAATLGVSRQIISAWENGKKELPQERAEQLSRYFGVDKQYFYEIDENQKNAILKMTMYRWKKGEEEFFLYRPDKDSSEKFQGQKFFTEPERTVLLTEEFKSKKNLQKDIVEQIAEQIAGIPTETLQDQIRTINRGIQYYQLCSDSYGEICKKSSICKMSYYFRAVEVAMALAKAFGVESAENNEENVVLKPDDYTYQIDYGFVEECAELIKKHMDPMLEKLK